MTDRPSNQEIDSWDQLVTSLEFYIMALERKDISMLTSRDVLDGIDEKVC